MAQGFNPQQTMANARHEFGEHGGVINEVTSTMLRLGTS